MIDILDPTKTAPASQERVVYAPRPKIFNGLRIGLVENTKRNSEAVLRKVAEALAEAHGMKMEVLVHKGQRAPLKDTQVAELQGKTDFAIIGVGD